MSRYFVPCTAEFLAEKMWEQMKNDEEIQDDIHEFEGFNAKDCIERVENFASFSYNCITKTVAKDLEKVSFDNENVISTVDKYSDKEDMALLGFKTLDNGFSFFGVRVGGDWEFPIYFIIYWDGKSLRGYIPTNGNPWNTEEKCAYGNDDMSDTKNMKARFNAEDQDDLQYDVEKIFADIAQRITICPNCSGFVSGGKVELPKEVPGDVLGKLALVHEILLKRPDNANSILNQYNVINTPQLATLVIKDLEIALEERNNALKKLEYFERILGNIKKLTCDLKFDDE